MNEARPKPDPGPLTGEIYRLVWENDRLRAFDAVFQPGDKAIMHWHPDQLVYAIRDWTCHLELPDGMVQQLDFRAGQATFLQAGSHEMINISDRMGEVLIVELKEPVEYASL